MKTHDQVENPNGDLEMLCFSVQVSGLNRLRLNHLDEWFREHAREGLLDEVLESIPLQPAMPTLSRIHDIQILEAEDLGDGLIEARCRVSLWLELLTEEGNTVRRKARMDITLEVNTRERKIAGHHLPGTHARDC